MPQTDRDRRLVEHLATKVCGLRTHTVFAGLWIDHTADETCLKSNWDPLEPSAATWEVWEKFGQGHLHNYADGWYFAWGMDYGPYDSGPRAVCEGVAGETGFEEAEHGV